MKINIHIHSVRKRLIDPDGCSGKAAIDGLVHAGVIPDDSADFVSGVSYSQEKGSEERTVITITFPEYVRMAPSASHKAAEGVFGAAEDKGQGWNGKGALNRKGAHMADPRWAVGVNLARLEGGDVKMADVKRKSVTKKVTKKAPVKKKAKK